jgi:nitrate reductase delta subunit
MQRLLRVDGALNASRMQEIETLIARLQAGEPLEIEAAYVELFDRGRATSLHLFEHVHGDSRERGPAMIDLGQTYESAGLVLNEGELPDYLPALLEFVSTQPAREAKAFLAEIAHLLNAIFGALRGRDSGYASLLGALLELAGQKAEAVPPAPEPPLDESWAEPAACDGCSTQGQARPGQPQPVRVVRRNTNPQGVMP